jgi:hypothetical protein
MFTVLRTVLHPETHETIMAQGQTITLDEIKVAQREHGIDTLDLLMEYGVIIPDTRA